jgi:MFS transporter, PPP family, 3-phenylpropionic acid transporter
MRMHLSSSRSMLYRFFILYGSLYAGFGVQSPYLPILLDNHHLRPETIGLALAAGMAMRLMAAQAVARRHSSVKIAASSGLGVRIVSTEKS